MKIFILTAGSILGAFILSQAALAGGFEKGITFGGQTSGVAGIGSPYITGSQALYFNPAGLVGDTAGQQDVSFNLSPTFPTFKGPIETTTTTDTTQSKMFLPFSLMYGQTVNDKLGWGIGAYVSGGDAANFSGVNFGNGQGDFQVNSDLSIVEIAAGVGYKVMDNLKIGATYRVAMVNASLDTVQGITSGPLAGKIAQVNMDNLTGTDYFGYKLGAQYKLDDKTKFGLVYRSEMNFNAKGTQYVLVPKTVAPASSSSVTASSVLPEAITLSAEHDCTDTWKSFAEVVWTEYSKVTNIAINANGVDTPLQLQLKDQIGVKLGAQYSGYSWPIRFGLGYATPSTNGDINPATGKTYALPTATPPGAQYTVTTGTGQAWGNWRADAGFEYTWGSGTASGEVAQNSVMDYAFHLGTAYSF